MKFQPVKSEKVVISVRLDKSLLMALDCLAGSLDMSRNEVVCQSVNFALEHIERDNQTDSTN